MGLNSTETEIKTLLRRHRFTLVSENRHYKYQNPSGRIFVCAKTPSDVRAYRNMLTTLKQVIEDPVPTSLVLEEERQRRELEKSIRLSAQERARRGTAGPARTNGTGILYYDKEEVAAEETARFVPDEVIAAEREREIARHIEGKWNDLYWHLKQQVRKAERDLEDAFALNDEVTLVHDVRNGMAAAIREVRREPEYRQALRKRMLVGADTYGELERHVRTDLRESTSPTYTLTGKQLYESALNIHAAGVDVPEGTDKGAISVALQMVSLWVQAELVPHWLSVLQSIDYLNPKFAENPQYRRLLKQVVKKPRFAKFAPLLQRLSHDVAGKIPATSVPEAAEERIGVCRE